MRGGKQDRGSAAMLGTSVRGSFFSWRPPIWVWVIRATHLEPLPSSQAEGETLEEEDDTPQWPIVTVGLCTNVCWWALAFSCLYFHSIFCLIVILTDFSSFNSVHFLIYILPFLYFVFILCVCSIPVVFVDLFPSFSSCGSTFSLPSFSFLISFPSFSLVLFFFRFLFRAVTTWLYLHCCTVFPPCFFSSPSSSFLSIFIPLFWLGWIIPLTFHSFFLQPINFLYVFLPLKCETTASGKQRQHLTSIEGLYALTLSDVWFLNSSFAR